MKKTAVFWLQFYRWIDHSLIQDTSSMATNSFFQVLAGIPATNIALVFPVYQFLFKAY